MMKVLVTIFLCGDVMLGRGIDQALPHSVDATLHEPVVTDARDYLRLTMQRTGPIDHPVTYKYIWGDTLDVLKKVDPAVRIINLENAITTSNDWDRGKGIHYRMHPANVRCLQVAGIDACVLANNHVLDWGQAGLRETLATLHAVEIKPAGAGRNDDAAEAPTIIQLPHDHRILVYAFAMPTSGVPRDWAATHRRAGVNYLPSLSDQSAARVTALIRNTARPGDFVVFSVHWGGNWGYEISDDQIRFAHRLIDEAGVDVVHGHSSHHPMGFEIYQGHPIFYGCGDFLNDYEGISGHEKFRPDLTLMYFPTFDPATGNLEELRLVPLRIRHLRLNRAGAEGTRWLLNTLNRECRRFGLELERHADGSLRVPPRQLKSP